MSVEEEHIKVHFRDMFVLVKWIKDIGANALMGDMFIGRDWLNRANAYYHQTFGDRWGVGATFEVIWAQAKKYKVESIQFLWTTVDSLLSPLYFLL